jgi:AraC-like DNA-binding protein
MIRKNKGYIIKVINDFIDCKTKKELLLYNLKTVSEEIGMSINTLKKYLHDDTEIETKTTKIKDKTNEKK